MNQPREFGGLGGYATADAAPPGAELGGSAGVEFTDRELDAYAEAGIDPVAEAAQHAPRPGAQCCPCGRRGPQGNRLSAGPLRAPAQQEAVYARQAQQAIDAARARGADESWIEFQLSMGTLPGHPGRVVDMPARMARVCVLCGGPSMVPGHMHVLFGGVPGRSGEAASDPRGSAGTVCVGR